MLLLFMVYFFANPINLNDQKSAFCRESPETKRQLSKWHTSKSIEVFEFNKGEEHKKCLLTSPHCID
jgi:hypothetical protein